MGKTLMIFGLGDLGGWALEFFARRKGLSTIVAADMREEWGTMKTHCAAVGAGFRCVGGPCEGDVVQAVVCGLRGAVSRDPAVPRAEPAVGWIGLARESG